MDEREKRKHVRVFVDGWQIRLISGPLQLLVGNVIDLSMGGLKFTCDQPLDPEETIDFELILPSGKKLPCSAEIAYRQEPEGKDKHRVYGAKFQKLTPEVEKELKEFIIEQLEKAIKES